MYKANKILLEMFHIFACTHWGDGYGLGVLEEESCTMSCGIGSDLPSTVNDVFRGKSLGYVTGGGLQNNSCYWFLYFSSIL